MSVWGKKSIHLLKKKSDVIHCKETVSQPAPYGTMGPGTGRDIGDPDGYLGEHRGGASHTWPAKVTPPGSAELWTESQIRNLNSAREKQGACLESRCGFTESAHRSPRAQHSSRNPVGAHLCLLFWAVGWGRCWQCTFWASMTNKATKTWVSTIP